MTIPVLMDGAMQPMLDLAFASSAAVDGRVSVTRSGTASTYFDAAGVLRTAAANTPRLDYDPATLAGRGLLIEEARTNLVVNSTTFNSGWTGNGATVNTFVPITLPDGTFGGYRAIDTGLVGVHEMFQALSHISGTTYTASLVAKAGSRQWVTVAFYDGVSAFGAYFDLQNGVIGGSAGGFVAPSSKQMQSLGNGWYRCSITATAGATGGNMLFGIASADGTRSFAGSGNDYIHVYHAQDEAGAFPTSIILSGGSATTRPADVATLPLASLGFNPARFSARIDYQRRDGGTSGGRALFAFTNGSQVSFVNAVQLNTAQVENSTYIGAATGPTASDTAAHKYAFAINSAGTYQDCQDGGVAVLFGVTGWSAPSITQVNLGTDRISSLFLNGWVRRLKLYAATLAGTTLQGMTR
ncbi:hypothetical protein UFOVP936_5 [uncultured Caudovirales phage]|uniref:Concanavalin A-like lectin/glucanases superfamily n=1 Tax=uncultured Caudovirales phage TaxID=2100421 RepID=A0A6J5PSV0_9CAUD|nr:hypothetical protein UFOVP936_5 [uncultured Caudovirales phage]